jgi:uncharacterized membrane protein
MTPGSQGQPLSPEQNQLGLERIVFFSDAVMAIAITLLVIDLKLPTIPAALAEKELPALLAGLVPHFASFIVSFIVVGVYWSAHHRTFIHIRRYDNWLIALNLLFLLFIALMPFFSGVEGQYGTVPLAVMAYSLEVAATGASFALLWWYASYRHRLVDPDLDPAFIRTRNLSIIVNPLVFFLAALFALLNPLLSVLTWWLSPFITIVGTRLLKARTTAKFGGKRHSPTS